MRNQLDFKDVESLLDQLALFRKELHGLMKNSMDDDILGLSMFQFHLLNMVHNNTPCNQKEIALEAHISKATLSVRIDKLIALGLIRKVVDVKDKRNFILEITPLGKDKITKGREVMFTTLLTILKDFTPEDIEMIRGFLFKLKNNMKEIKEEK